MSAKKKQNTENQNTENESVQNIEDMINALKETAESFKAQAEDYKDRWLRGAAEFDNYRKRNANLRLTSYEEGRADVILKILPIGDNIERAVKTCADKKTKEGLLMLQKQFDENLSALNVTEIPAEGEAFDANLHEALQLIENENKELSGKVKDVYLKGYKQSDKILRYSVVSLYK